MREELGIPPRELQTISETVENELRGINHAPFSDNAFAKLKSNINDYAIQLINESVKTKNRRKSDVVSSSDVENANQYLITSSGNKLYRNIGTLGGILLGAGLSTFLSMLVAATFTTTPVLVALILTLIGMFMVAFQIAKD